MTLTIELTPDVERALVETAHREGQTLEATAAAALQHLFAPSHLVSPKPDATLTLFEQWDQEDATDDTIELEQRDQEWREIEANLRADRVDFSDTSGLGDEKAA
ncbi:MAG: hypothetical protein ABIY70_11525 [Capsulimonas sp.]|uniref:hypothetical protein n=1 Tax=Capsulimonas sp. TaxID=2494211 RepID=UPI003267E542